MEKSTFRVLVVDDSEPWRNFFSSAVQKQSTLEIVGRASDGLEAVQQAQELQPDLILLDIGLPTLNGIEAARRIRKASPRSKILFVSENRSEEIAEAALSTGAGAYVVKSDAASELLPAIEAVLKGKRFVSTSLADYGLNRTPDPQTGARLRSDNVVALTEAQDVGITRQHEVEFYSDESSFLDGFTKFIGAALNAEKAVIVVATESHRDSLVRKLHAYGLDIGAEIEQGRYISLDAADTLATFMVNGLPDPVRFMKVAGDLIVGAAKAVNGKSARVAACGESAPLLWAQGNIEAAIRVEHLWNEISITHKVDILCGYQLSSFQGGVGSHVFEKICSVHSAVYSR